MIPHQGHAAGYQSNLRKMVLEQCRHDTDRILEDAVHCFPLLEALRWPDKY